jgi:hypothetical protein
LIVGLIGWAGSGKDAIADILVKNYRWHRIAFADPLRDFLYAQDVPVRMDGQARYATVSEIIDKYGWDGYKQSPYSGNMRRLIQVTGTEAGRQQIHQNVWVDAAIKRAEACGNDRVVFSDCRFYNEVNAVRDIGGKIVRVYRPGVGPANNHASENEINKVVPDVIINNNGTLRELRVKVAEQIFSVA